MDDKLNFVDGVINLSIESKSRVFIKCYNNTVVKRIICGEKFALHNLSNGNKVITLDAGEYEISVPIGCSNNCFVCVDMIDSQSINSESHQVCIKKIEDDFEIKNVRLAWACIECKGDSVGVSLFEIDGSKLQEPELYEII